jgi:uncharacterized membrane protein
MKPLSRRMNGSGIYATKMLAIIGTLGHRSVGAAGRQGGFFQRANMTNQPLSPSVIQAVQALAAVGMLALIAGRFLPSGYRQPVGIAVTVAYVAVIIAFAIYAYSR